MAFLTQRKQQQQPQRSSELVTAAAVPTMMPVQYAYAQPSHYGAGTATAGGIPPAAYQTSYIPLASRIMAGHAHGTNYPSSASQATYAAGGSATSPPYASSMPTYSYQQGYAVSGSPTYPTPGAGAGATSGQQPTPQAQVAQYNYGASGASTAVAIQSFTSTTYSYSAGGVQTTYSVSSVSTSNAQGGLDVYRSTSTKHYGSDGSSAVNYTYDVAQHASPSSSNGTSPTSVTHTSSTSSSSVSSYDYPAQVVPQVQPAASAPVAAKRAKSITRDDNYPNSEIQRDHPYVWQWNDPQLEYARRSRSTHREREQGRGRRTTPARYPAAVTAGTSAVVTAQSVTSPRAYEVEEVDDEEGREVVKSSRHSSHGGSRRRGYSFGDRESEAGFKVEEVEESALGLSLMGYAQDSYPGAYGETPSMAQALVPYKGVSRR